jgi:hypothetical protein
MNELRRLAYLEAMGIDAYISRTQLPGAGFTRRLAIVRAQPVAELRASPPAAVLPEVAPAAKDLPNFPKVENSSSGSTTPVTEVAQPTPSAGEPLLQFSLAALVAGDWLWLEELAGIPLAREQVQLIQAMATVLSFGSDATRPGAARPSAARPSAARPSAARPSAAPPQQAQFNWPIHTNQQLDLGPEAARSAVAGFIRRKLEQHGCRGLILLGRACLARVPLDQLECPELVQTVSTAEMLKNPALKKQAWLDLRPLVASA